MPRLGLLLIALLALATTSIASACPPPPPGQRCSKYDFMFDQMALNQYAPAYVRTSRAVLAPRVRGARALRLLLGSTWTAREATAPNHVLAFFDAAAPPATVDPAVRSFLVRTVTWRADHYELVIDDVTFSLARCRDDRGLLTTCLVRGAVARLPD